MLRKLETNVWSDVIQLDSQLEIASLANTFGQIANIRTHSFRVFFFFLCIFIYVDVVTVHFILSTFLHDNKDDVKSCFIKFKLKVFEEATPLVSTIRSKRKGETQNIVHNGKIYQKFLSCCPPSEWYMSERILKIEITFVSEIVKRIKTKKMKN